MNHVGGHAMAHTKNALLPFHLQTHEQEEYHAPPPSHVRPQENNLISHSLNAVKRLCSTPLKCSGFL